MRRWHGSAIVALALVLGGGVDAGAQQPRMGGCSAWG